METTRLPQPQVPYRVTYEKVAGGRGRLGATLVARVNAKDDKHAQELAIFKLGWHRLRNYRLVSIERLVP